MSFHNPDVADALAYDADRLGGLPNAYGRNLIERYSYVSDSNGYGASAGWLTSSRREQSSGFTCSPIPNGGRPAPAAPRDRIVRCVEGRAASTLDGYDTLLATAGRKNIR